MFCLRVHMGCHEALQEASSVAVLVSLLHDLVELLLQSLCLQLGRARADQRSLGADAGLRH